MKENELQYYSFHWSPGSLEILQIYRLSSNSIFYHSLLHPRLVSRVLTPEPYDFQQTHNPSCAKCVINGTVATAASVVVGTQKQCGSSAVKKRMPVRDENLALIHVPSFVSPRPLRWVFVVPVLVGACWFQELLNWSTLSGSIDLVGSTGVLTHWLHSLTSSV